MNSKQWDIYKLYLLHFGHLYINRSEVFDESHSSVILLEKQEWSGSLASLPGAFFTIHLVTGLKFQQEIQEKRMESRNPPTVKLYSSRGNIGEKLLSQLIC
jgi:hypothetical protein